MTDNWQTDDTNVQDVLDKGLTDLMALCDVVVEKFEDAQKDFKAKNPAPAAIQA